MTLVKVIALDNGTNGNNLTTGLTGYAVISGTTPTYSNAYAPTGLTLSARAVCSATTSIGRADITTPISSPYYRGYRKLVTLPAANTAILQCTDSTGTIHAEVQLMTTGVIRIRNASFTVVATSGHTFAANDVVRLEWNPVPGGTQTLRLFWGANVDGATPDETLSGACGSSGTVGRFYDGICNATTVTNQWAGVAIDDTTWVGPDVPGTPSATGAVAKSWDGGAWVTGTAKGRTAAPAWVTGEAYSWDGNNWQPVDVTIPPTTTRFPGDPGQGNFYFDVIHDNTVSGTYATQDPIIRARLSAYSPATARTLSLRRIYNTGTAINLTEFQWALDNDRVPLVSFKGDPTSITNGSLNSSLDTIVSRFDLAKADEKAVWWTYYHEPEDNFTTSTAAAQYRAACRYIKAYFDAAGCDNVAFCATLYMAGWTWNPASGRDWRWWWPDWRGTSTNSGGHAGTAADPNPVDFYPKGDANAVVDILGLDVYHYDVFAYGVNISKYDVNWFTNEMASFSSRVTQASGASYPICIGETGWYVKQTGAYTTGSLKTGAGWVSGTLYEADTQTMLDTILPAMIANDVVGVSYWNQCIIVGGYYDTRLLFSDPNRLRDKAIAEILDSTNHIHPPTAWTP